MNTVSHHVVLALPLLYRYNGQRGQCRWRGLKWGFYTYYSLHLFLLGLLPYFQVLPFANVLYQNFVFPGIALLCVNGIPNLIAAVLLLRKQKSGVILGGILGLTLMAWITIQCVIFPSNFMSNTYFTFGILQTLTSLAARILYQQEHFIFHAEDYSNIGRNPDTLVVYFSRMGYTRKLAYEAAGKTGAALYEIKTTERTEGTPGLWWCGHYGMRSFCRAANGKIGHADYILVHHMGFSFSKIADEMDRRWAYGGRAFPASAAAWEGIKSSPNPRKSEGKPCAMA